MEQEENPLFTLVRKRMKLWDDEPSLSLPETKPLETTTKTAAKIQLKTLVVDTPATEALEQFLLFASSEETDATEDESPIRTNPVTLPPAAKSLGMTRKTGFMTKLAGVHDVTRGLARITAAN